MGKWIVGDGTDAEHETEDGALFIAETVGPHVSMHIPSVDAVLFTPRRGGAGPDRDRRRRQRGAGRPDAVAMTATRSLASDTAVLVIFARRHRRTSHHMLIQLRTDTGPGTAAGTDTSPCGIPSGALVPAAAIIHPPIRGSADMRPGVETRGPATDPVPAGAAVAGIYPLTGAASPDVAPPVGAPGRGA